MKATGDVDPSGHWKAEVLRVAISGLGFSGSGPLTRYERDSLSQLERVDFNLPVNELDYGAIIAGRAVKATAPVV